MYDIQIYLQLIIRNFFKLISKLFTDSFQCLYYNITRCIDHLFWKKLLMNKVEYCGV